MCWKATLFPFNPASPGIPEAALASLASSFGGGPSTRAPATGRVAFPEEASHEDEMLFGVRPPGALLRCLPSSSELLRALLRSRLLEVSVRGIPGGSFCLKAWLCSLPPPPELFPCWGLPCFDLELQQREAASHLHKPPCALSCRAEQRPSPRATLGGELPPPQGSSSNGGLRRLTLGKGA
ncbi:hypothetical protein CB1_000388004 [Camelus ferus]|nr:hypothetical protein CB1_000388004 [Camelus ferus]